jgi:two-component system, chemotaxis family, chemotaxis protein CheY
MRALIVEDDVTSRLILENVLKAYSSCDIAMNGLEAIAAFRSALDQSRPYDLICMDIMMPELDGQAALRQIRQIEKQMGVDATKVVMTTAKNSSTAVADALFDGGACAYFVKPINIDHFIKELKTMGLIE